MSAASPSELAEHLADTPAAAMCAENNERMLGSVRATATPNMAWWPLLVDQGDFSVRDFIQQADDGESRWLFITYRDDQLAQLRNLVSALIDVAIIEMLSLDDAKHRRFIIALDELDALGPVATLGTGLDQTPKIRRYRDGRDSDNRTTAEYLRQGSGSNAVVVHEYNAVAGSRGQ